MSVDNNGGTTDIPRIGGVTGKGFVPGQSGNPSGRPAGIAKSVRQRFNNSPLELVDALYAEMRNERARPTERIQAARTLLEFGWGKAATFAAIEGQDPLEMDEVAAEIKSIAEQLRAERPAAA